MRARGSGGKVVPIDERGPVPAELRRFIWDIQSMVELAESEREILMIGSDLLSRLLASDDWLPPVFAAPEPAAGRQFQIYRDGMERFCVVSTVLAGGAALIVDQPGVWEIAGGVAGSIERRPSDGAVGARLISAGAVETLRSGRCDGFRLSNAHDDRIALAIHVYGGEIGRLDRRAAGQKGAPFGYANDQSAPPYDIFSIQADIRD
ncbi:hypothetical protein F7D14_06900 [Methylocystis parvus]|uniref:Uncharacterized protein n=2 Tax=Methylocystis parvus TaxID=134 RepID=A0A6B8MA86_9HYPH|nr:hypothetical protein F7D14_06900 [Methylocystis parvus]